MTPELSIAYKKGIPCAVKFHMGELGNPDYIQPFFIHGIIRRVKEAGGKPFLTDSSTAYRTQRNNSYDHMKNALMTGEIVMKDMGILASGLASFN